MDIVFKLDGTNTSSTYATTLASSTTMNTTYSRVCILHSMHSKIGTPYNQPPYSLPPQPPGGTMLSFLQLCYAKDTAYHSGYAY